MTISPLGDSAVLISLGERVDEAIAIRVRAMVAALQRHPLAGVRDIVGAFASIAVFYEVGETPGFAALKAELETLCARADEATVSVESRRIEIPVCYGGEFGPDLDAVARHAGVAPAEVIARHCGADYLVHAIGFAPGFPYLGGLPAELAMPRRATPRTLVPAGSVGIGGAQTGIYPFATPGGWNLIGRTPLALFDVTRREPSLLKVGDRVSFQAIDAAGFQQQLAAEAARIQNVVTQSRNDPEAIDLRVIRGGMLTTVQDLGRTGHRAEGVPAGGAADSFALRVANLLVGNAAGAAALEFTLVGPELRFAHETVIAATGADFGLPRWRPLRVRAGETIDFGGARSGCRGYLAIAGGVDVPTVLGSRSTHLRAHFGGLNGRPVTDGSVLPVRVASRDFKTHWRIDERILPPYSAGATVRVVRGAQAGEFRAGWEKAEYRVTPRSDRMGIRLEGHALARTATGELTSLPVAPGTVQVPPDGQPIALLADAQTIGGYPQLAHVASVDLPLLAQLRPGDILRFRLIELEEAHALILAQERALGMLREGLAQKLA